VLKKTFTLALSDLSLVEIIVLTIGIIAFTIGVFFIGSREAYGAALTASLVNPYEYVRGYIYGVGKQVNVTSFEDIKGAAVEVFLSNMVNDKLIYWILYLLCSSITLYPLITRLRNSLIPTLSVIGVPVSRQVWIHLLVVVIISIGFTTIFLSMVIGIYLFYFNKPLDYTMLIYVSSIVLFMILFSMITYIASAGLGREYFGVTLAFLLCLVLDKLSIPTIYLSLIALIMILALLFTLHVMVKKRWITV